MTCQAGGARRQNLSIVVGAIALCVIVSVFIALPSTWGGPTLDPDGIAIATSTGDALTAPHALAPAPLRVTPAARVCVTVLTMLTAAIVLVPGERRQEGDARHGSTFIRSVMRRRGPPTRTFCSI